MPRKRKPDPLKKTEALETLKVEYVTTASLEPNAYNPNRQNDHEFDLLCRSIREDGFTQPIIVGADGKIVDGEHRWRAAREVGMEEIPIVRVPMEAAQARIATLRHNRARGSEDLELSVAVLRDLEKLGALDWATDSLQLDDTELSRMLEDVGEPEVTVDPEEVAPQPGDTPETLADRTREAVDNLRKREKALAEAKTQEDREAAHRDNSVYRLILTYTNEEAAIVRGALDPEPALNTLALCKNWAERTGWQPEAEAEEVEPETAASA